MLISQTQKPPIGTPLDRTSPLLNGLLWFSPCWENGGGVAADVIAGNSLVLAPSTTWLPGQSPQSGGGIGCLAAGRGAVSGPWTSAYKPTGATGPWSLVCGVSWTGVAHSSFGEIFGITANNINTISSYPIKIQWSSTNNFFRIVTGSSALAAGSAAVTANKLLVLVATLGSGGSVMYVNGSVVGSAGVSTNTPLWSSGSGVWCGSSDPGGAGTSLAAQTRFHFGAVYNRALSAGEAQAWTINPWQLFASSPSLAVLANAKTFSVESFTAGTSTILGNIPTGQPVALTGVGTNWSSGTTFTVSGLAGTTLASQSITSATSATLVINTGSTTGSLTISDGTTSTTISVITRARPKWFPGLNRHNQRCMY
jgi:hypothetical protein